MTDLSTTNDCIKAKLQDLLEQLDSSDGSIKSNITKRISDIKIEFVLGIEDQYCGLIEDIPSDDTEIVAFYNMFSDNLDYVIKNNIEGDRSYGIDLDTLEEHIEARSDLLRQYRRLNREISNLESLLM